jgi:hypothetical protein
MTATNNATNNSFEYLQLLTNTGFLDPNGNTILGVYATTSAIQYAMIANAPAGNGPVVIPVTTNSDPSIHIHFSPKNTGTNNGLVYMDGGGVALAPFPYFSYLAMPHYPVITADTIANRLVAQTGSISTAVTLNSNFGVIETYTNNFNINTVYYFTLNNTYINTNSVVLLSLQSSTKYPTNYPFVINAQYVAAGSCTIMIYWVGAAGSTGNCNLYISFGIF